MKRFVSETCLIIAKMLTPLQSEKHLTEAWQMCHKDAIRNKE
jgi:hypothetical protein